MGYKQFSDLSEDNPGGLDCLENPHCFSSNPGFFGDHGKDKPMLGSHRKDEPMLGSHPKDEPMLGSHPEDEPMLGANDENQTYRQMTKEADYYDRQANEESAAREKASGPARGILGKRMN